MLSRVARGDRAAAVACVERYGAELLALARRLGVDEDAAPDAVREIFRTLWREVASRRSPPADETGFVFQLARRVALQHESRLAQAANPREPVARDAAPRTGARPRQSSLFGDTGRVARALATLAPDERATLELAVLNGLPYPRVAFLCGLPTAVARDAARRGLLRVSELLHDEDASPRGEARP